MFSQTITRGYLVPTSILAVFIANGRLANDLSSLPATTIVGAISVIGLFFVRLRWDSHVLPAIAYCVWWSLVYLSSCLLPIGFYLRKHEDSIGLEPASHLFLLLISSTLAMLLWFWLDSKPPTSDELD